MSGPLAGNLEAVIRKQDQLDQEEEEAIAKILCLCKQKKLLQSRARDMLSCSLKTLDKLEAAEEAKQKETEHQQQEVVAAEAIANTLAKNTSFDFLVNVLVITRYLVA